ncbi:hypothetical protein CVT26_002784 [Gymnopilus dilepis]|uniref:Uncharacterized protein n=1 Tax=Gymnopilus dilepis TaxID=231916 RepID=A0A409VCA1_9AGAR|nr:hypothetical protein CVT26_002784 [Gymnopilus dilepis]
MVYVGSFPEAIPAGVAVPGWAYLDVTAEDNFDQTNAKKDSNATESSAVPPSPSSTSSTPSSTGGKTTSVPHMTSSHSSSHSASTRATSSSAPPSISVSSSPSPSASAPASSTEAFSEKQANAVGGGVIGGLFGVVIIFAFLYWFILRRRRRLARDGERLASPTDPENASWHAQGPYMAQRQAEAPVVQSSTAPSINNSLPPNSGPHEQAPSSNAASVDSMSPVITVRPSRWSTYKSNCTVVYDQVFTNPIPSNVTVPHYAYLNVVSSDTFNVTLAENAGGTESTAVPTPTGSNTSSSPSPTTSAQSKKKSNAGAIAGGVIGGIVGLAILVGLAAWFILKRRPKATQSPIYDPVMTSQTTTAIATNPMNSIPSTPLPKPYDPNDPSTFPTNMNDQHGYHPYTPTPQLQYPAHVTPNYTGASQPSYPRPQYTGAPELTLKSPSVPGYADHDYLGGLVLSSLLFQLTSPQGSQKSYLQRLKYPFGPISMSLWSVMILIQSPLSKVDRHLPGSSSLSYSVVFLVAASGLPSSSIPASTSTTSSSTQTSSTSSSPPATSSSAASNSSTSSKSHSNAGAIAGGVIGGLVVLVGVCLLFLWRYVSKKRNAVQKDLTFDSRALVSGQPTGGTTMSQTTGFTSRSPESYSYGPSPVPFSQTHQPSGMDGLPLSPATTAVYTSPPQASRRSLESVSPSLAQFGGYQAQPNPQGGYRGAAEV